MNEISHDVAGIKKRVKPVHIEVLKNTCDLCGACLAICPPNVMSLLNNDLSIEFNGCTYCSLCIDICPVRALEGKYDSSF